MSENHFDSIVIGAGIEGSATAYNLAKLGRKTLLIEKFPLPTTRGSSHGMSRVMRKVFAENTDYVALVQECYSLWYGLQRQMGYKLLTQTGLLWMGLKSENTIKNTAEVMKKFNLPREILNASEISKRFPTLNFPEEWMALFDPEACLLHANRCLQAFQEEFVRLGGTVRDGEPVLYIRPGKKVTVTTSKSNYTCDSVVLCLGPWMKEFCKTLGVDLPLQVRTVKNCYWKAQEPEKYSAKNGFPITGLTTAKEGHFYGTPSDEYPGLTKFCWMEGADVPSPDARDQISAQQALEGVSAPGKIIEKYFGGLSGQPAIVETCMFTMTPDWTAIVDRHPKYPNILIAAGFSDKKPEPKKEYKWRLPVRKKKKPKAF